MSDPIDDPKGPKSGSEDLDKLSDKDPLFDEFDTGAGGDFASLGGELGSGDFADLGLGSDDPLPSLDDLGMNGNIPPLGELGADEPLASLDDLGMDDPLPSLDDLGADDAPAPLSFDAPELDAAEPLAKMDDALAAFGEEPAEIAAEPVSFGGFSLEDQPHVEGFDDPLTTAETAESELPEDPLSVSGPLSLDDTADEFPLAAAAEGDSWPTDDAEDIFGETPSLDDLQAHSESMDLGDDAASDEPVNVPSTVRKYMFDTSFDPVEYVPPPVEAEAEPEPEPEPIPDPEPEPPPPPPPPTFSEEELAAAKAAAYADGEAAGNAQAQQSAEMKLARAVESIGAALPGIMDDRDQAARLLADEAARLAYALVRKAMPELNRRYGLTEIEAIVKSNMALAIDQPRIIIRVASDMAPNVENRFEAIAQTAGYQGRIMVLGDAALGPADVKLDWGDGGAERLASRIWNELTAIVARAVEDLEKTAPVDQHPTSNTDIGSAA